MVVAVWRGWVEGGLVVGCVFWHSILGQGSDIETRMLGFTYIQMTDNRIEFENAYDSLLNKFELMEVGLAENGVPFAAGMGVNWKLILLFELADLEQQVKWGERL